MMTWEEHTERFALEEQEAIDYGTCFCLCGHRGAHAVYFPMSLGYDPVAGLCAECLTERKRSKKGRAAHTVLRRPHDSWVDPAEEQEVLQSRPKRRFRLFASDAKRLAEATEYAKEYGVEGSRFMALMHEKVMAGQPLTGKQVEAILRTKAAEQKSLRASLRRLTKESERKGKVIDLNRIRLDDVRAGDYAVEGDAGDIVILRVRRPKGGVLRGFTVVEALVGQGVQRYGIQRPHPYRDVERFASTYQGHMPHLVADLVANPLAARVRYEQLTGKPV